MCKKTNLSFKTSLSTISISPLTKYNNQLQLPHDSEPILANTETLKDCCLHI